MTTFRDFDYIMIDSYLYVQPLMTTPIYTYTNVTPRYIHINTNVDSYIILYYTKHNITDYVLLILPRQACEQ